MRDNTINYVKKTISINLSIMGARSYGGAVLPT